MRVNRYQALRTELSGGRPQALPLSAKMMTRAEYSCLIACTIIVRFIALLRLDSALPDPVIVHVPVPILILVHISPTALVSIPAPVPVPILCS